jgi:hypothetical protein
VGLLDTTFLNRSDCVLRAPILAEQLLDSYR